MKTFTPTLAAVAILSVALPSLARSDDDHDHDRARDLYERGEIHALSDILAVVGRNAPGDVVGVDLVRVGERWVYRFQVVTSDGHRNTVEVDAGDGTLIGGDAGDQ